MYLYFISISFVCTTLAAHFYFPNSAIAQTSKETIPEQRWQAWRQRLRSKLKARAEEAKKLPPTYHKHYKWTSEDGSTSFEHKEWASSGNKGNYTYVQQSSSTHSTTDTKKQDSKQQK